MVLYHELLNALKKQVTKMDVGEKLPSERQLCLDHNVSRTTVRSAIAELEKSGYVERLQGKGTFVSRPPKRQNLSNYYSFTDQTRSLGKTPKTIILDFNITNKPSYINKNLGLENEENFIAFTRLRLADDEKMLLETTYVPYKGFEELTRDLLNTYPLYNIFENYYNLKVYKVREDFSVDKVNKDQAEKLGIKPDTPVLKIKRTSYDKKYKIIEFTVSYARADIFNYETIYYPN